MSMSREEVAKELGLTVEQIRQTEELALRKLKQKMLALEEEDYWVSYLSDSDQKGSFFSIS